MSTIVNIQIIKGKKVKRHKYAFAVNEPTEKKAICVNCGTEMEKSKIGGKHCTRYTTASGEVFDIHFGDKAPECKQEKI